MKRYLRKWELTGIGVIFLLGGAFHFIFESTGSRPFLGVFFPVNESVYEHLKMTFWPAVLWAAFSYRFVKPHAANYFTAKAAGFITMPLAIIILFYGYTGLFNIENVVIDIIIFLIAVTAGQLVVLALYNLRPLPRQLSIFSALFILMLGAVYTVLTFYPPHTSFFMDSNTGTYGVE